jgi:flagellar basal-body rod modification protein FlgD
MSTTSAITGSAVTQTPTTTKASTSLALDANEFLKLFVAELKNQDPTKPMETTDLVQQMSNMSQVEQSVQTNAKLATLLDQISIGQATGLVGLSVTSADGSLSGVVQSVKTSSTGLTATLTNGSKLEISQGVSIGR